MINDVVLEYRANEYTQIDHIVIGPPGVFLLKTKAWDGSILLKKDQSYRKESYGLHESAQKIWDHYGKPGKIGRFKNTFFFLPQLTWRSPRKESNDPL